MDGDIQLMAFKRENINIPPMPKRKFKKKLEMKELGKIMCFEGKVPSVKDMIGHKFLEVLLMHDTSEFELNCK